MSRRLHTIAIGAVALVLLGAATLLDGWLPDQQEDPGAAPFMRAAEVGDRVDLRALTVQVDSVSGAKALEEYGTVNVSPGVWVVVEYTVVGTSENTSVGYAELRDGVAGPGRLHDHVDVHRDVGVEGEAVVAPDEHLAHRAAQPVEGVAQATARHGVVLTWPEQVEDVVDPDVAPGGDRAQERRLVAAARPPNPAPALDGDAPEQPEPGRTGPADVGP